MKILMIAINDPAGTAIAFSNAINKYTTHTCRLLTREIRYNFMFEKDLHFPLFSSKDNDEIVQLLEDSDVIHFHMTADEFTEFGDINISEYIKGKILVHHHHGHPDFRSDPQKYKKKYKDRERKNILVSTPDLLKLLPEAKWLPNIVPINDNLYLPLPDPIAQKIVISHAPTRRDLKNTADLEAIFNDLKKTSNIPIELHLIENVQHKECLEMKRHSHIIFDHMQGYYGVSSLESLSQGKPVIAGLDEWNIKYIKEFTGADALPWQIARDYESLGKCMTKLINDAEFRCQIGKESRLFMEECWKEQDALKVLLNIYENA